MTPDGCRTVVCVASGPSFTIEQAELIAEARRAGRCRVIVVNDNWRRIPADVLYAADFKWWQTHFTEVRAAGFAGELWTQFDETLIARSMKHAEQHAQLVALGLHFVKMKRGTALYPRADGVISCGANGGFQAIMLARLRFDPIRIPLVGYDMQRTGGLEHWFGAHPKGLANGNPDGWVKHFAAIAPALRAEGIDVINCTIATALTCFRRADLATILAQ